MMQYLAKFLPNLSEVSAPLRKLLKGETIWHWECEQQRSFTRLKELVSNTPVLKYYDVKTLSVDASSGDLRAGILQGQPVAYGSRSLTDCEQRYAQIEKELLAMVNGCTCRGDMFRLSRITNRWLQKMLMRLQKYRLQVRYKPGKEMYIADALSSASLTDDSNGGQEEELDVRYIVQQLPVSEEKRQQ